jgi:hypothetical protein
MADQDALRRNLRESAEAIGRLASNEDRFRALIDSFRASDSETFQRLLGEQKLIERCELVCGWLCSKECVLTCLELCGLPTEELPNPREFADVVVRITTDEELVERLANAIQDRKPDAFNALVMELKIEPFCQLLCHWACSVRCRLICDLICPPVFESQPGLVDELTRAGKALEKLIANEGAFKSAEEAVRLNDCNTLAATISDAGLVDECAFICEFFCTWRCLWVCLTFCRPFLTQKVDTSLTEAFQFAKVSARLAEQPEALTRLGAALEAGQVEAWEQLIKELQLEPFCIQLCHWICFEICELFCRCACPSPFNNPLFTRVGDFAIYTDIAPGTGLTSTGIYGHGGPGFGFFECLKLVGFCPKTSPVFAGVPMRYRFLYEQPPGNKVPLVGNLLCQVVVGTRLIPWWNGFGFPFTAQTILVKGSGATPAVTPPPGLPVPGVPWPGPPPHVIVPDASGWIQVDQSALDGGFVGNLIGFDSTQAFPGGAPAPGVAAGTAVPVANQKNGTDAAIIFEATRVGGPTSPPDFTNTLARIHINNWLEVSLLDLLQFHSGGGTPCSPLSTDLDIEYTTDHELMAAWEIGIVTAATPMPPLALPSGLGPRGAAGTHHENITTWPSCSYAVQLTTRRSLTDGLVDDVDKTNQLTFCK